MSTKRDDEIALRKAARAARGKVVVGSGSAVEPRKLDQMVSLRLDPEILAVLRDLAKQSGIGISELLRAAAAQLVASSKLHPVVVEVTEYRGTAAAPGWSHEVVTFSSIKNADEKDRTNFSNTLVNQ